MELLNKLAENGVLSIILAISLYTNAWLARALLAEKDKRIEGAEKVRDDIASPLANLQKSNDLIYEKIVVSKEAQR